MARLLQGSICVIALLADIRAKPWGVLPLRGQRKLGEC
jgi:hypothetical protein